MSNVVIDPYTPYAVSDTELVNQTGGTGNLNPNGGTNCGVGWELQSGATTTSGNSAFGKTLTSFTFALKKSVGGTGTLNVGVWNSSNNTFTPTTDFSGEKNIANLTTSYVYEEYTGSHLLALDDTIACLSTSQTWNIQTWSGGGAMPAEQNIVARIQNISGGQFNDSGYEPNGVAVIE